MHPLLSLIILALAQNALCNCYPPEQSADHFKIISENTVETRRGCEVLCDTLNECTSFSFRDVGLQSACSLLGTANMTEICSIPMKIYRKNQTGCTRRDNITAELGEDPCVEEIFPDIMRQAPICPMDTTMNYVIRAVLADGKEPLWTMTRLTLYLSMKTRYYYNRSNIRINVVAAVCASAGATKCPCDALPVLSIDGQATSPVRTGQTNPCAGRLTSAMTKIGRHSPGTALESQSSSIMCQAGKWQWWYPKQPNSFEIVSACCT